MKKRTNLIGLCLSILLAFGCLLSCLLYLRESPAAATAAASAPLFHAGMDVLGTFVCAVLFYGCMGQIERATRSFSLLILLVSASFFLNEWMWFIAGVSRLSRLFFACCLLSKWLNLALIYLFFLYGRGTLQFQGKLAYWSEKSLPILLLLSMLIVLANVFGPVTFTVDAQGIYSRAGLPWLEDLYLLIAATVTTVLIFRCTGPRSQKWAAMSFILIPVCEFLASGGAFAYAAQYGAVLLSLILMYCILFNDRSRRLAATQTELTMASQIQESILPSIFPPFPNRKEIDIYASMHPAREVGGDFYDFFLIDEDHLGLLIGDVSGKGIPAALFMMISRTLLQNYAKLGIGAAETLRKANEAICSENSTDMFVTAWIGILEIPTGRMLCASAGHEYPAICRGGRFEMLHDRHGFVLGGMEGSKYHEYDLQLSPGDKIFVYTDGVPEATNSEQKMFGTDRMLTALNRDPAAAPSALLRTVRKAVDTFVGGAEPFDDLTMLCLEYRGRQGEKQEE